jgi:hypothetical protein
VFLCLPITPHLFWGFTGQEQWSGWSYDRRCRQSKKYLTFPEGSAMVQEFVCTPDGKETIGGVLPHVPGGLNLPTPLTADTIKDAPGSKQSIVMLSLSLFYGGFLEIPGPNQKMRTVQSQSGSVFVQPDISFMDHSWSDVPISCRWRHQSSWQPCLSSSPFLLCDDFRWIPRGDPAPARSRGPAWLSIPHRVTNNEKTQIYTSFSA